MEGAELFQLSSFFIHNMDMWAGLFKIKSSENKRVRAGEDLHVCLFLVFARILAVCSIKQGQYFGIVINLIRGFLRHYYIHFL